MIRPRLEVHVMQQRLAGQVLQVWFSPTRLYSERTIRTVNYAPYDLTESDYWMVIYFTDGTERTESYHFVEDLATQGETAYNIGIKFKLKEINFFKGL